MTKKIIIEISGGCASLSQYAIQLLAQKKGISLKEAEDFSIYDHRTDDDLISIIEELGEFANDDRCKLKVEKIECGRKFIIQDPYDRGETIKFMDEIEWITL